MTAGSHHPSVVALLKATPAAANADAAIRIRARALIEAVKSVASWHGPAFDLEALASFKGFRVAQSGLFDPSQDACIMPGIIVLNANKPARRRRYSLAHEIAHTLFPDYDHALKAAGKLWRANGRSAMDDPAHREVERLCDVGASELLLPEFTFLPLLVAGGFSLETVVNLSARFDASMEATCRRATDASHEPVAALLIQPWDAELRRATRAYSARATLRISRSYSSPSAGHWLIPSGTCVPTKSVAVTAWTHAPLSTRNRAAFSSVEVWPGVVRGEPDHAQFECQAIAMPLRSATPSDVVMLMRLA